VILVRGDLAGLHLPLTSLASAKIRFLAQKISADGEAISAVGQPRILELQRAFGHSIALQSSGETILIARKLFAEFVRRAKVARGRNIFSDRPT
jgi:hypothetical protein